MEMHQFKIINMSDACTIEAPKESIAIAATLLLGEGAYGLEDQDGKQSYPFSCFQDQTGQRSGLRVSR